MHKIEDIIRQRVESELEKGRSARPQDASALAESAVLAD